MSVYPQALDTDLELPRVEANITEIGGDAINALRDAVFNLESALGVAPAGNKVSLAERVNVSIDANGKIKAAALDGLGLVTLPINNSHIDIAAAIAESKLDLDFSTQSLRNLISSLQVDSAALQNGINVLSSNFNSHITGQGQFHDGYQIKINTGSFVGVVGLDATTIGDAINEIAGFLFGAVDGKEAHIDFSLPNPIKHVAAKISVDTTNFNAIDRTVTTVQEALEDIDSETASQQSKHVDDMHANGILKEINSGDLYNPNQLKFRNTDGYYTAGSTVITMPGITSFSDLDVNVGDIILIENTTGTIADSGTHKIRAVGPQSNANTLGDIPELGVNQLGLYFVFTENQSDLTVDGYAPASVSSENAPLACSVRHSATRIDAPTILNPDAARVVSLGFNGSILNGDGYDIRVRVGMGSGTFRELTIPDLNRERLSASQASVVNATSVAERINAYVSDPVAAHHFPISAFKIGNELAIAHNLVGEEYTIEILSGQSGNFALGFDEFGADVLDTTIRGNTDNLVNINGTALSAINTLFDGYAEITSATDTFAIYHNDGSIADTLELGIYAGSVIHITDHATLDTNGSYTVASTTQTTVSVFGTELIDVPASPTTFNVKVTEAHTSLFSLISGETNKGLLELLIDSDGRILRQQRLIYGTGLGPAVKIINVSAGFPVGDVSLIVSGASSLKSFTILDGALSGVSTNIHEDFKGTIRVYHPNNIDFLTIDIIPGTLVTTTETVSVYAQTNDDEALLLCSLHFDGGLIVDNVFDLRQFGNISTNQVRDDFIEVFSQIPVKELRSDGVARGFDVLNIPFVDSISGLQALPLSGGVAYVNGVRCVIETQRALIQSYDSSGILLPDRTVVVGINEFGTLRAFDDDLSEILSDGYSSSVEFGKILPLYTVLMVNGEIGAITDVRRFINNIDEKLELIVDETNNVVGNFRSLEGALLYADKYPDAEKLTVRILNKVYPSGQVVVPAGVSIVGNAIYGGEGKHAIVNANDINDTFIELLGDNRMQNIQIESEVVTLDGYLVAANGKNIELDKCLLTFTDTDPIATSSNDFGIWVGPQASRNVRLTNNRIDNVFSGIVSMWGCEGLVINDNTISNVAGTASSAYGIKVANKLLAVNDMYIKNNTILVGDVGSGSDIQGIVVDVSEPIGVLRLTDNDVLHSDGTTMTNGIRIENTFGTGNVIDKLIATRNTIDGIELNDNDVWGMNIANVKSAIVNNNIIKNVGQAGNTNYGMMQFTNITGTLDVVNNVLEDGNVTRGIDVSTLSGIQVRIVDNTIKNIGANAYYIFGSSPNSTVHGNTLTGPGLQGIRWTGARSSIDHNILNAQGASYAFSEYGIFTLTNNIDVTNNVITGMTFSEDSVGISNGGLGRSNSRITNNTVTGDLMSALIELFGSGHLVSQNKLFNASQSSNNSNYITLNSVSDTIISENIVEGVGQNVFLESGTTTGVDFNGNKTSAATIANEIFSMPNSTDCSWNGNSVPDTSVSTIGNKTDGNSIGFNKGFLDSATLNWSQAQPQVSSTGVPDWILVSGFGLWTANTSVGGSRDLYFSLHGVPNGAKLIDVNVGGDRTSANDTLTAIVQRSTNSTHSISTISSTASITATGVFDGTGSGSNGLVTLNAGTTQYVDHSTYSYVLKVSSSGGANMSDIHHIVVNFRY